jgi:hypothetical protein
MTGVVASKDKPNAIAVHVFILGILFLLAQKKPPDSAAREDVYG